MSRLMAWIEGQDLASVGYVVREVPGARSVPEATRASVVIPGRAGVASAGLYDVAPARPVSIVGTLQAPTPAQLEDRYDALMAMLVGRTVTLRIANRTAREAQARFVGSTERWGSGPRFRTRAVELELRFALEGVYWTDTQPTVIAQAAGALASPLLMGTAPCFAVIRVMGPATNPVVTIRDVTAAVVASIGLTRVLTATDYAEIDLARFAVTRVQSGVASNDLAAQTSGDFFALSPEWCGPWVGSAWVATPTIEVSSGAVEILYYRSWI